MCQRGLKLAKAHWACGTVKDVYRWNYYLVAAYSKRNQPRKAAEDAIFGKFLEENQGWKSKIKEIVSEYKAKDIKERQDKK